MENIDDSKTKAYSPQTKGICERFHRTMQEEFHSIAFRKRLYSTLEDPQTDLDAWLEEYSGPFRQVLFWENADAAFLNSKHLSDEKQLDRISRP